MNNSWRQPRTRNVTCSCGTVFTRLTRDRYQVCLACVTRARLAMKGITARDPGLAHIANYNAPLWARAQGTRAA